MNVASIRVFAGALIRALFGTCVVVAHIFLTRLVVARVSIAVEVVPGSLTWCQLTPALILRASVTTCNIHCIVVVPVHHL